MERNEYILSNTDRLRFYSRCVNEYLKTVIDSGNKDVKILAEAMRYSLLAGGKRLRPALLIEFYRIASGCESFPSAALPYAAAIEMLHTYSLIHDDLPCMDNDSLRRGIPTCHNMFGEATALLAGDALLTEAFRFTTEIAVSDKADCEKSVRATACLSRCAGYMGMCGGQELDLRLENGRNTADGETLLKMYTMKTSALISASCAMGCIAAGRFDMEEDAFEFGRLLGLAFQITDDILDETGDTAKLGKNVGSDKKNGKRTYLSAVGMERARKEAEEYIAEAKKLAAKYEGPSFLVYLCDKVLERDS